MTKKKKDSYGFVIQDSNDNTSENNNSQINTTSMWGLIKGIILIFMAIGVVVSIVFAGFVAWHCYVVDLKPVRIFKTIMASIFSIPFLMYFYVLRVLLKVPCY
jgi:hypothetical protein